MRSLNLNEFPHPFSIKTGWPWFFEDVLPKEDYSKSSHLPRISIVTPSFNQGLFLEESIRSVLMQGYSKLEYFVFDGGSQDNSIEIIKKYSTYLTYWHSQKDKGQSDAINQGLQMATGEIVAWLNSDDFYLPGVFERVAKLFEKQETQLIYGRAFFVDEESAIIEEYPSSPIYQDWRRFRYWRGWPIPQPTVFMRRELLERFGYLDTSLHYALDYDLLIRLSCHVKFDYLDVPLANYRIHLKSKTGDWMESRASFFHEDAQINRRYAPWYLPEYWLLWIEWLVHISAWHIKNVLHPFVKWLRSG